MSRTGRPARGRPGDDTGSLAMVMLLSLVGVLLGSLLVPIVVTQLRSTSADVRRARALHAAQAGFDVAVGHIRAAVDTDGDGVLSQLPCFPGTAPGGAPGAGLLTGSVSAAGTARYEVQVDYFDLDPQGKTDAWLAANRLACVTGGGVIHTPAYALLRSTGTDSATGAFSTVPTRSLTSTYTVQTSNQNIVGGLIHVFQSGTVDLCMDAGSASPTAGANLQMQPCSSGGSQTFAYTANLNLVLVSTVTPSLPLGMCLDAGSPHALGAIVKFQPCTPTTSPRQQWSLNDAANFEGTSDGATLDGLCFTVQTRNTPGSFVILGSTATSTCRGGYDNVQTFSPEPTVGAGAAGAAVGQLVNFDQFGRCLDVTEQNVSAAYLIAWPCKQAPNSANVTWNQKWKLPVVASGSTSGTGRITTTAATGIVYCLTSPLSLTAGVYPVLTVCPATTPSSMTWTVYVRTEDYESSYRIIDSKGYCLQPNNPAAVPPDLYPSGNKISKIVVSACGSSSLQKWNAPANILDSLPLKDIGEK